jgi:hypothetical protein
VLGVRAYALWDDPARGPDAPSEVLALTCGGRKGPVFRHEANLRRYPSCRAQSYARPPRAHDQVCVFMKCQARRRVTRRFLHFKRRVEAKQVKRVLACCACDGVDDHAVQAVSGREREPAFPLVLDR